MEPLTMGSAIAANGRPVPRCLVPCRSGRRACALLHVKQELESSSQGGSPQQLRNALGKAADQLISGRMAPEIPIQLAPLHVFIDNVADITHSIVCLELSTALLPSGAIGAVRP